MSLLCDFEVPVKNQLLLVLLYRRSRSVSDDVNIGNNGLFATLSLSDEDLMFLLVSSLLFLLRNLKKSLRILLGFVEPDSRSLCCCKFILFFSSMLGLYSRFQFSLNHFSFSSNLRLFFLLLLDVPLSIVILSLLQCPLCDGFV